jgi:hypothetical protein
MPDTWPALLAEAEAQVTGPDPYRSGWQACMEWLDPEPPEGLTAEDREIWLAGFEDAMDSPLGSAP